MHAYRWIGSGQQDNYQGGVFFGEMLGLSLFFWEGKGSRVFFFSFCRDQRSACKRAGGLFILSRWCVPGFCFFPFHHITLQLLGFLFTLGLDYGSLDTPIGLGREEEYLSNNGKGENIKVGSSLPDDQTLAFFWYRTVRQMEGHGFPIILRLLLSFRTYS